MILTSKMQQFSFCHNYINYIYVYMYGIYYGPIHTDLYPHMDNSFKHENAYTHTNYQILHSHLLCCYNQSKTYKHHMKEDRNKCMNISLQLFLGLLLLFLSILSIATQTIGGLLGQKLDEIFHFTASLIFLRRILATFGSIIDCRESTDFIR